MGFRPFSGGPFRMINKIGIDNFIKTLENNRRQFGERYNPTNLLYQYKDKPALPFLIFSEKLIDVSGKTLGFHAETIILLLFGLFFI